MLITADESDKRDALMTECWGHTSMINRLFQLRLLIEPGVTPMNEYCGHLKDENGASILSTPLVVSGRLSYSHIRRLNPFTKFCSILHYAFRSSFNCRVWLVSFYAEYAVFNIPFSDR